MDNKTRLVEAEFAACLLAVAIVAFTLFAMGLWTARHHLPLAKHAHPPLRGDLPPSMRGPLTEQQLSSDCAGRAWKTMEWALATRRPSIASTSNRQPPNTIRSPCRGTRRNIGRCGRTAVRHERGQRFALVHVGGARSLEHDLLPSLAAGTLRA